jgi:hypothetical protein
MSAYQVAIEATIRAIEQRARYFRNQIVLVVAVSLAPVTWALLAHSTRPLAGAMLLIPVLGAFVFADHRVVDEWRSGLLAQWAASDLDFAALRSAIRAHPAFPRETTEGMLATLPSAGVLTLEQGISRPTRRAVAAVTLASSRTCSDVIALKVAASGIIGGALVTTAVMGRWQPLTILASLPLIVVVGTLLRGWRRSDSERIVAVCRGEPEFSEADFARLSGICE